MTSRRRSVFFTRKEGLIILLITLLCLVSLFFLHHRGGKTAVVSYKNTEIQRISLSRDGEYVIQGDLPVTLEVRNGKIRFIHSVCRDHICESYGWLGGETDPDIAICLPAGIIVQVVGS